MLKKELKKYIQPGNTRYLQIIKHAPSSIIYRYRPRADSQHGDLVLWSIHFIDRQFQEDCRQAIPRRGRYVNRSVSVWGSHVSFCRVSGTCVKRWATRRRRLNADDEILQQLQRCAKIAVPPPGLRGDTSIPNHPLLAGKLEMKTARVRVLERSFPRESRKTRNSSLGYVRWNCSRVCIMLASRHLSSHAHGAP